MWRCLCRKTKVPEMYAYALYTNQCYRQLSKRHFPPPSCTEVGESYEDNNTGFFCLPCILKQTGRSHARSAEPAHVAVRDHHYIRSIYFVVLMQGGQGPFWTTQLRSMSSSSSIPSSVCGRKKAKEKGTRGMLRLRTLHKNSHRDFLDP